MNPKKGHRPLVQIGVVATAAMARASSSGGAARNVDADGTRPKRPPQTKARTSGFFAAQEESSPSGRAGKRRRRATARMRQLARRGCANALTLILDHTRGPQIAITRRQFAAMMQLQPVTSPSVQWALINTRSSYEAVCLHRRQAALMRLMPARISR